MVQKANGKVSAHVLARHCSFSFLAPNAKVDPCHSSSADLVPRFFFFVGKRKKSRSIVRKNKKKNTKRVTRGKTRKRLER